MRVIIDVMGGDHAPLETLKGTMMAAAQCKASFLLIGDENEINRIAEEQGFDLRHFDILHTPTVITMEDDPLSVVRGKKDSSMSEGLRVLAEGKGDVFVSAGNTGALFTGATLIVRRIRGIRRAAIGSVLPMLKPCLLIDSGANVTVSEEDLLQFAAMGSAYMEKMYGIESPAAGLLNNGTEEHKGTPMHQSANKLLGESTAIRYVGNVEANAVPFGVCDVLVTDGFTGNVLLKSMEGMGKMLLSEVKGAFMKNRVTQLSALLMKKSVQEIKHRFDASEYGGAPFLGISRPVIKAHGSSDAKAFKNAILEAIRYAESDVIYDIAEAAERFNAEKKADEQKRDISENTPERGEKNENLTNSAEAKGE